MKLSFSTNAFTRYPVAEAVRTIAALGYQGVEILADRPHLFCPDVTPELLHGLQTTLDHCKLTVANINANTAVGFYGRPFWEPLFEPSLANPDPEARSWRIQYTKASIDIAKALGAANISITSGRMVPGVLPSESLAILKDSLTEVLAHARDSGVRIGIEYEPGLLIESCAELAHFLEGIDSPWLGANLDIGHSHVAGEDVCEVVRTLGAKIFHVHVEDIKDRKHFHLIPGAGDLDFAAILAALARQSYAGYITVELYSYPERAEEAARLARAYLIPIINQDGHAKASEQRRGSTDSTARSGAA